jgi:hypothetical protein
MFGNFIQEMIAQAPSNPGGIPGLPGTGAGAAPLATDWVSGITNLAVMGGAVLIPFVLSCEQAQDASANECLLFHHTIRLVDHIDLGFDLF